MILHCVFKCLNIILRLIAMFSVGLILTRKQTAPTVSSIEQWE